MYCLPHYVLSLLCFYYLFPFLSLSVQGIKRSVSLHPQTLHYLWGIFKHRQKAYQPLTHWPNVCAYCEWVTACLMNNHVVLAFPMCVSTVSLFCCSQVRCLSLLFALELPEWIIASTTVCVCVSELNALCNALLSQDKFRFCQVPPHPSLVHFGVIACEKGQAPNVILAFCYQWHRGATDNSHSIASYFRHNLWRCPV